MHINKFSSGLISLTLKGTGVECSMAKIFKRIGGNAAIPIKSCFPEEGSDEEHQRLTKLEDENKKLKELVADLLLDRALLREILKNKS